MQSAFHNVPTINGVLQSAGREYCARDVKYQATDQSAELTMDLASAYPSSAKVDQWQRTVRLNRGDSVELVEKFKLKEITGPTLENLMTPMQVETNTPGQFLLRAASNAQGSKASLKLEFDPHKLSPVVETIELKDSRLIHSWGNRLYRIQLRSTSAALEDTWRLRISTEPATAR